jgi:sensor histidine kinase YesM
MNGQGMWETKKKKSHKKRRKQKHIDILNEPPRLKSTFYKDLNRGPKNIWKLQTIK